MVNNPWGWQKRPSLTKETAATIPRRRPSVTPTFDRLTEAQIEALADPSQPLPPAVTWESLLKEASRLWLAEQLVRQGLL